jgi:hypothetical protein
VSLSSAALRHIEDLASPLAEIGPERLAQMIETGELLSNPAFSPRIEGRIASFFAPFEWVNETADIVLIGITPGKHQATQALLTLQRALRNGSSPTEAAALAKQAASFDGDMRTISAKLMDRFRMNELFGVMSCADLFGSAASRVHYTSILRRPVLVHDGRGWGNYSGKPAPFGTPLLERLFDDEFAQEVAIFRDAWLVPFGPVPAQALAVLVDRGVIRHERVLAGLNHPSGTQWNRHRCQLNTDDDHRACAPNVGCATIRARSAALQRQVERLLAASRTSPSAMGA